MRLANVCREVFVAFTPTVRLVAVASEAAFVELAPGKTLPYPATHGYVELESVWSATDACDDGALTRFDAGLDNRTAQLSLFGLTGIALAGANLPAYELVRCEGILTAQEIAGLELSSVYRSTLSSCNTSIGVCSDGAGLAFF